MDKVDSSAVRSRSGAVIVVVVVVGIAVLGAGGYLAWSKRRGGGEGTGSEEFTKWCAVRQEWGRKVGPLAGDILLKSARPETKAESDKLFLERNQLCAEFAGKLRTLGIGEPTIGAVEAVLIKEGRARANFSVEIYNLEQKLHEADDVPRLSKVRDALRDDVAARIAQAKASADKELNAALAAVEGTCPNIYRGPATDTGTADSPHVTWDEVELKRATVQGLFDRKIKKLEPVEEFTNRIYHEMVRLHRPYLSSCFKRARARNPQLAENIGLQVRLKKSGEVGSLAIVWGDDTKDYFLDCLLEKAAKWKLPRPDPKTEVVVVTLDFSKL